MNSNAKLLSLKWKALIVLTLLLIFIYSCLGYLNYRNLDQQLQSQLDLASRRSRNNLVHQLEQNKHLLQTLAESSWQIAQQQPQTQKALVKNVDQNWTTLHEQWELDTVALLDDHAVLQILRGRFYNTDALVKLAAAAMHKAAVVSTFYCSGTHVDNRCALLTAVPLPSHQVMAMSISVADLITDFSKDNFLNIALLSSNDTGAPELVVKPWHFNLVASTDLAGNLELLQSAATSIHFAQLLKEGAEFKTSAGKSFYLHALSMDTIDIKHRVFILLIDDITAQREELKTGLVQTLLTAAFGMLISEIGLLIILWQPLERIKWQSSTLPLLADGDYESVYSWPGNRNIKYRDELDVLEEASITLASRLSKMSLEIRQRSKELEYLALHDVLTGLANRRLFVDRLTQALSDYRRTQTGFAVLFIDIDHFKRINDSLGHDTGDDLLVEVARRIKAITRSTDAIARFGGDEFIVLLEHTDNADTVITVINKMLQALQEPLFLNHKQVGISGSIGVAMAPENGLDPNMLIKYADMAMYQAKTLGRNTYYFFTEVINVEAGKLLDRELELHAALDAHQFELFYQPIVKFPQGDLVGFEALVRWNHPERGIVSPAEFISVMENNGSIVALDREVVHLACRDLRWLQQALGIPIILSVNVSTHQLRDATLVEYLRAEIETARISPGHLKLEVTESALMEDIDRSVLVLNQLKLLGVKLSIDDFGTGYSSLNYLKKLPVDELKIDRSFVSDIPDNKTGMEITAAVIAMAHKLQLRVVAEGIEDERQVEFLLHCHCDFGQGYLFHRPASRATIAKWARTNLSNSREVIPLESLSNR